MEDIRIYNFDFELLAIENKYTYVSWTLKYNGIGTFEARFSLSSKLVDVCLENDYLIAVQGDKQAIITGKQANDGFILYGRTPTWILSKRVTPKFTQKNGTPEAICASLVTEAFSDVENFEIKRYSGNFDEITFWRNVYNPTEKVVSECLDRIGAGHRVYIDIKNKKWIYEMLMGSDNPLVISSPNKNAYNNSYTEDCQEHCSGGWYESYSEDENGESVWKYIESDKTGIYKWIGVLGGDNLSEAQSSLESRRWKKEISLETKSVKYGVDYNLGDTVKVQVCFGNFKKTLSEKIKGVEIICENGNLTEQPVFY